VAERKDGLIICDFDGVFNEGSPDLYYEGYYIALNGAGCELSIDEQHARIDEKWGSSHKVIIKYVMAEKPEYASDAVEIFEDFMESVFTERIQGVDGSVEMLGRLASKYTLALNTAAPRNVLMGNIMPKLGIDKSFFEAGIVTADQLSSNYSKPSPHIINIIRERQGYQRSRTVMVGDSVADMESAKNAGVEPIAVTGTGNLTDETVKELPYVRNIVDKVTEIEELVPKIINLRRRLGGTGMSGMDISHMTAHR
jgi:phosphoglycolate phosphatase-like HAD superfamily hydrolase